MVQLTALAVNPPTFDPMRATLSGAQLLGSQIQNATSALQFNAAQQQQQALQDFAARGGFGSATALQALQGQPQLFGTALQGFTQYQQWRNMQNALAAQRVLGAGAEGSDERTQSWRQELATALAEQRIDQNTYAQFLAQPPSDTVLQRLIDMARPLGAEMTASEIMRMQVGGSQSGGPQSPPPSGGPIGLDVLGLRERAGLNEPPPGAPTSPLQSLASLISPGGGVPLGQFMPRPPDILPETPPAPVVSPPPAPVTPPAPVAGPPRGGMLLPPLSPAPVAPPSTMPPSPRGQAGMLIPPGAPQAPPPTAVAQPRPLNSDLQAFFTPGSQSNPLTEQELQVLPESERIGKYFTAGNRLFFFSRGGPVAMTPSGPPGFRQGGPDGTDIATPPVSLPPPVTLPPGQAGLMSGVGSLASQLPAPGSLPPDATRVYSWLGTAEAQTPPGSGQQAQTLPSVQGFPGVSVSPQGAITGTPSYLPGAGGTPLVGGPPPAPVGRPETVGQAIQRVLSAPSVADSQRARFWTLFARASTRDDAMKLLQEIETGGKEREAAETARGTAFGQAQAGLPGAMQAGQSMIGNIDAVLGDPNLGWVTGVQGGSNWNPITWLSSIPNMFSGPAMETTRERLAQLQGQAFMQAYQSLRGAGQISEQEGARAGAAIARLNNLSQSDEGYVQALNDARREIWSLVNLARARAGLGPIPYQSAPLNHRPAVGDVFGGYRFNGGDPSQQGSWRLVGAPQGQSLGTPWQSFAGQDLPVLTPEQAQSLPPGTQFRGTDGEVYLVPRR